MIIIPIFMFEGSWSLWKKGAANFDRKTGVSGAAMEKWPSREEEADQAIAGQAGGGTIRGRIARAVKLEKKSRWLLSV